MYIGPHVKHPLFLSDFNETWIFSTDFRKNPHISNYVKIHPVGAELFHADERTDMSKLIVAFRDFANAPKIRWNSKHVYGFGYYHRAYVFQNLLFENCWYNG